MTVALRQYQSTVAVKSDRNASIEFSSNWGWTKTHSIVLGSRRDGHVHQGWFGLAQSRRIGLVALVVVVSPMARLMLVDECNEVMTVAGSEVGGAMSA